MRLFLPLALPLIASVGIAQQTGAVGSSTLPDAPSQLLIASAVEPATSSSSAPYTLYPAGYQPSPFQPSPFQDAAVAAQAARQSDRSRPKPAPSVVVDADGKPIPLERQQPQRILGFMPNFRSVAGGAKPHPPGWKYTFHIATRQAFDYSSFVFLGLTSITAEGLDEHPVLGKGIHGFYSYTWRGFLDKTDGTYLGGWFLPSLLHEDTRFYSMEPGHSVLVRSLYVISRQGVARTYGGRQTPNIAGLGGKVLTQLVSRQYYPTGASDFGVLAEKFGYAAMRDVAFSSIREFYPGIAAHYVRKHREKVARLANAAANQSTNPTP